MAKANSNGTFLIPAVAYVRMSSDKQEASPEQQRKAIKELAARLGYRIIRWYTDEGISGDATEKRFEFQRMIADASKGDFKAILCWDQDRFGRFDSIEAGLWIHPLRKAGIYLVDVTSGKIDWNEFSDRLIYTIKQEGKHAFLRDLSRNVCRGLRAKAERGEWPNGTPPFGYIVGEDGKLAFGDPLHVRAVQRVFREYLAGNSMMAIVEMMVADNVPAPGKGWDVSAVKFVLKNRNYTGDFVWGGRAQGKYNIATDAPIEISKNHASIVSPEMFDAAQKRRAARRSSKTPQRNGGHYTLSGLLECSQCESSMCGHTVRGHRYMLCDGYQRRGKQFCSRNSVREDLVLDLVIGAIEDTYLNPGTIKRLREEMRRQAKPTLVKADVGRLKRQLAKNEKDMSTARRNMVLADSELRPEYEVVFRELKRDHERLAGEIKAASVPQKDRFAEQDAKVDQAIKLFSQLRPTLKQADPVRLREFLRTAIDKIVVRIEKTRVGRKDRYRLLGGDIHMKVSHLGCTPC